MTITAYDYPPSATPRWQAEPARGDYRMRPGIAEQLAHERSRALRLPSHDPALHRARPEAPAAYQFPRDSVRGLLPRLSAAGFEVPAQALVALHVARRRDLADWLDAVQSANHGAPPTPAWLEAYAVDGVAL